jgi:hypothetical protein
VNSGIPILCLLVVCAVAVGQQAPQRPAQATVPDHAPVLVLQGIGRGVVPIDGNWQFHLGDDPSWAQPSLNDSHWETIHVDDEWGAQGHPLYSGFAWYRRHIDLIPAAGATGNFSNYIEEAEDAYEIYWNGKLIRQYGTLPPHASSPNSTRT